MTKQTEPPTTHVSSILPQLSASRERGEPLTLTINGQHTLILKDDLLCERLLDFIDQVETVEGIRRGLDDFAHGRSRSLEEVMSDLRDKYELHDQR